MSNYHGHDFDLDSENNSWSHLYKLIRPKTNILDVGCANGNFGAALIDLKKCEVTGIDLDDEDVKLAQKKLTKAYKMDVNSDDIKRLGKYDHIIFADVIEHLVSPRETLIRISKLLKPGGTVLFSIPNMAHISVRLDLLEGRFPYKNRGLLDSTHLHFYDYKEVESVFMDSGYAITNMNPVISNFPQSMVKKRLQKIGLVPQKGFVQMISDTKADIFQFIGSATPSSQKTKTKNLEYVMPQDLIRRHAEDVERRMNEMKQEFSQKEILLKHQINNMSRKKLVKKIINKKHKLI